LKPYAGAGDSVRARESEGVGESESESVGVGVGVGVERERRGGEKRCGSAWLSAPRASRVRLGGSVALSLTAGLEARCYT
jgi:hypothetical protein